MPGFRKRLVTLHLPWMKCIWRKLPEKNCFLWLFAVRFKFGNCFLRLFYSLAPSLLPQLEVWVAWDSSGHNLSSSFYSQCRLLPTFCKSVFVDSQWRQRRFATRPTRRVGWPLLQSGRRKESWLVGTFQDCVIQISGPEDLQLCTSSGKSPKLAAGRQGSMPGTTYYASLLNWGRPPCKPKHKIAKWQIWQGIMLVYRVMHELLIKSKYQ